VEVAEVETTELLEMLMDLQVAGQAGELVHRRPLENKLEHRAQLVKEILGEML
jgi:hypothetical protein